MIAGLFDKAVPIGHCLEQSYLASVCDFYILKHSAHKGMLEEPAESTGILAKFLQFTHQ